jgi:hypothetical protein
MACIGALAGNYCEVHPFYRELSTATIYEQARKRQKRLATMIRQHFPPGWDEERVREVIAHYENQTEDEQFAAIEAARETDGVTLMAVPTELVPEVRALLARKRNA